MTGLEIGVFVPQLGFTYPEVLFTHHRATDHTLELLASEVIAPVR